MPFNWKKRFHLSTFANAHYFQQLFKCELTQADKGFCRDCCCCFLFLCVPRLFYFFRSRQPPHTAYVFYQSIIFRIFSINLYTYTGVPVRPERYELYISGLLASACVRSHVPRTQAKVKLLHAYLYQRSSYIGNFEKG